MAQKEKRMLKKERMQEKEKGMPQQQEPQQEKQPLQQEPQQEEILQEEQAQQQEPQQGEMPQSKKRLPKKEKQPSKKARQSKQEKHAFVEFCNVTKTYQMGEVQIKAADGISFSIEKGEFVIIVGPSGAGKTTVLNILGGMDTCTEGQIFVDGTDITQYDEYRLTGYRRDDIGFVFQFYNLVGNLTALENVELALQICEHPLRAVEVMCDVGLEERLDNFPAQLSGGEQQRVAIARALAKNPKLLLCDEPTGALDYQTGKSILKLLQDTCRERGKTVVVITHNQALTPMADRVIRIKNGTVSEIIRNEQPASIDTIEW